MSAIATATVRAAFLFALTSTPQAHAKPANDLKSSQVIIPTRPCHTVVPGDEFWSSGFEPRLVQNARVNALTSVGDILYAAGYFRRSGEMWTLNIAAWDGVTWKPVGAGAWGAIDDLEVIGNDLYISGDFNLECDPTVTGVARWDGTSWHRVGATTPTPLNQLATDGVNLFAAGAFAVYMWNGVEWTQIGDFGRAWVSDIEVDPSGNVYVGGGISRVDGVEVNDIAMWDGAGWSSMDGGLQPCEMLFPAPALVSYVTDIHCDADRVVVAGEFSGAGDVTSYSAAFWDGSGWHNVWVYGNCGWSLSECRQIHTSGELLYWSDAYGDIKNGTVHHGTYVRDGQGKVTRMTEALAGVFENHGDALYAGFGHTAHGASWRRTTLNGELIASWDGTHWTTPGVGLQAGAGKGFVYPTRDVHVPDGGVVYLAGRSTKGSSGIYSWGDNDWLDLRKPSDIESSFRCITLFKDEVYAGGLVTQWYGNQAQTLNIGKYGDQVFAPLGEGLDSLAIVMVADAGNLYVGGEFEYSGALALNHVGRWDGTAWHALETGVDGIVRDLDLENGVLYVGGYFRNASGLSVNAVARWDGFAWSGFGDGCDGQVTALVVASEKPVVGCETPGAGPLRYDVRYWTGAEWVRLGQGFDGAVHGLALSDGGWLYATGEFENIGDTPVGHVARWDGASWQALGSGLNGTGFDVDTYGQTVYLAGDFGAAGPYRSRFYAEWREAVVAPIGIESQAVVVTEAGAVELSWALSNELAVAHIDVVRNNNADSQREVIAVLDPSARSFTDETATLNGSYDYELEAVRRDGTIESILVGTVATPTTPLALRQNYPNPFNPTTIIEFSIDDRAPVSLTVYDAAGRRVATLVDRVMDPGNATIEWDGRNAAGGQVASGIYLYLLRVGDRTMSRKMALVR